MSRSSARRGQVEPLAALAAVLAVGAALALYAGVVVDALPRSSRDVAEPTIRRVRAAISHQGIVVPRKLPQGLEAVPDGYGAHLSVVGTTRAWHVGPPPGPGADRAAIAATVRTAPATVEPVTLRVEVWPR